MKKYLLTMLALFSVVTVAMMILKLQLQLLMEQEHLSTKEEKKMQFQYSLI